MKKFLLRLLWKLPLLLTNRKCKCKHEKGGVHRTKQSTLTIAIHKKTAPCIGTEILVVTTTGFARVKRIASFYYWIMFLWFVYDIKQHRQDVNQNAKFQYTPFLLPSHQNQ